MVLMVGEPLEDAPGIESLYWDYRPGGNVEHVAKHGVTPADVAEVLSLVPRYFQNARDPGSIVVLGPNADGRYLAAVLDPTFVPSEWTVATANWMGRRRAERLYRRGIK